MVLIGVLLILSVMVFAGGYMAALSFLISGSHPKWATLSIGVSSLSFISGAVLAMLTGAPWPVPHKDVFQMVVDVLLLLSVIATWWFVFRSWARWPHTHPVEI